MEVGDAIANILKLEGVEFLFAYPVKPLIEAAAKVGIRPIVVRQERGGLHMADAFSRTTSGERVGFFACRAVRGLKTHSAELPKLMGS